MIQALRYNKKDAKAFEITKPEELTGLPEWEEESVLWLNLSLSDMDQVTELSEYFGIHPLTVEDILNVNHLPKFEAFEDYYFFTLKDLEYTKEEGASVHHISLILKEGLVISFLEKADNPVFQFVQERIMLAAGNLRNLKADHLFYRLIDLTVDDYLNISGQIRDEIEDLDNRLYKGAEEDISSEILDIKREINSIRRISMPLRDELGRMRNNPSGLLKKTTLVYLQDVSDHVNHLLSSIENDRDILKDLMDLHLSNLSHSMNEVMKTLTVVATIFIPLTFLAGIYGMNFQYIPELDWKYSYPVFWLVCILLCVIMVIYMKKKKWF